MKEIKFRWYGKMDGEDKARMHDVLGIHWGADVVELDEDYGSCYDLKSGELVEYTGLHDKNGKEIYEGDIRKYQIRSYGGFDTQWITVIAKITMHRGMWYAETIHHTPDRMFNPLCGAELENTEYIGNIYENAELLQPQEAHTGER